MGERRKWDKQPQHPDAMVIPTVTAPVSSSVSNGDVDPVREKQMQYIKMLEERNRLKKKLAQTSKKDQQEKRREDAFTTTFNVTTTANTTANGAQQQETVRKNKSSAALLPTRIGTAGAESRGRSAPSTTLPLRYTPRGDEQEIAQEKASQPHVHRAKWKKPAAGELFGIDSRNGKNRLCVEAKADEKDAPDQLDRAQLAEEEGEEDEYQADEYSEESFEEFEDCEDSIEEDNLVEDKNGDVPVSTSIGSTRVAEPSKTESKQAIQSVADASSSSGLSRTTTELFSVVQNLSRSKQKALVDLLQKFDASDQKASDIHQLQASIGDPGIWKQISAAILNGPTAPREEKRQGLTLAQVMEEQQRWEEEYAKQVQEKLVREREAKEKGLRDAEERRTAMMKQLEDEERELERLMEQKRRERLDKLKALEAAAQPNFEIIADVKQVSAPAQRTTAKEASFAPGENSADSVTQPAPRSEAKVPELNLSSLSAVKRDADPQPGAHMIEVRVRLLSTWGNTRAIGLSQICVYDTDGAELAVDGHSLNLYERPEGKPLPKSHEMSRTISRLFTGVASTSNEHDMWLGRLSDSGMLEIGFFVDSAPSKLCIWNFNSKMCSACTRDVEIFVQGKCVWSGSLPQGFGNDDDNVCMWINVLSSGRKTARGASAKDRPPTNAAPTVNSTKPDNTVAAPTSSGPIWLSTASSSHGAGSHSARAEPKSSVALNLDDSNHFATGGLTSRRQRGDSEEAHVHSSTRPSVPRSLPHSEDKSNHSASAAALPQSATRESKHGSSGVTATISPSWDTLEHFSKTSRSRLPSATEEPTDAKVVGAAMNPTASAKPFVPTTTSTLLAELRGIATGQDKSTAIALAHAPVPIPELPSGKRLKVEILSTWGDQFYVGLNGVEIFDHRGKLVAFDSPERQVVAHPASINVLEDYTDDPRVATNLVDGVNDTCDDFHMWLAPYTAGEDHYVTFDLGKTISLSMVRVWNYNKSRAHTFRGVRHARLRLFSDGKSDPGTVIFEGEIERAPGALWRDSDHARSMWSEVILFTTDQSILQRIEANDALVQANGREELEEEATTAIAVNVRTSLEMRRPRTSDNGESANSPHVNNESRSLGDEAPPTTRPPTSSARRGQAGSDLRKSIDSWVTEEPQQLSPVLSKVVERDEDEEDADEEAGQIDLPRGRRLVIRLLTTWGDKNYIGLTQLDVLVGAHGSPLPINPSNVDATPRDLASLGYQGDPRTLDKLVNGVGTTCDDANMWLVPLGSHQEIRLDLKREQFIYGLRIWNYNKSLEDSFRGAKQIVVTLDGKLVSPRQTGFILRKAPGNALFDFDQIVRFPSSEKGSQLYVDKIQYSLQSKTYKTPTVKQDYEPPLFPQGFLLKFVFWTTWGDPYYLGLNGIELYDAQGKRIIASPTVVTASPHSLGDLEGSPDDIRVPENLVSGKNKNTWDASDAWLAPLASSLGNNQGNILYLGFDTPVVLSLIKFWNYSKTPERGVKDMDIYLDDLQIFSGALKKAPHGNAAQTVGRFGSKPVVVEEFAQPVLFSTNQALVDQEKRRLYYCGKKNKTSCASTRAKWCRSPRPCTGSQIQELKVSWWI